MTSGGHRWLELLELCAGGFSLSVWEGVRLIRDVKLVSGGVGDSEVVGGSWLDGGEC